MVAKHSHTIKRKFFQGSDMRNKDFILDILSEDPSIPDASVTLDTFVLSRDLIRFRVEFFSLRQPPPPGPSTPGTSDHVSYEAVMHGSSSSKSVPKSPTQKASPPAQISIAECAKSEPAHKVFLDGNASEDFTELLWGLKYWTHETPSVIGWKKGEYRVRALHKVRFLETQKWAKIVDPNTQETKEEIRADYQTQILVSFLGYGPGRMSWGAPSTLKKYGCSPHSVLVFCLEASKNHGHFDSLDVFADVDEIVRKIGVYYGLDAASPSDADAPTDADIERDALTQLSKLRRKVPALVVKKTKAADKKRKHPTTDDTASVGTASNC